MADLPRECRAEPKLAFDGGADGLDIVRRILNEAGVHLTPQGGLLCEIGRCRPALEAAYPQTDFLWLDTEDSDAEVFWIDAACLESDPPALKPFVLCPAPEIAHLAAVTMVITAHIN